MISVSLNEVYSETYKALRSVNIEWSLAKDCANKAKWLAQHGQYFLGSILKTADLYKNNKISISINKNTSKKPLSSALMALLLVEYVSANKITWEGYIDNSKFLLAAMGIIAEEQKINLILENEQKDIIAFTKDKEIYVNANLDNKISSYYFLKTYDFIKKKNIKFTNLKKNKNVTKLNTRCWQKLKSMAFETYVPESETSKSGAGY